MLTELSRLSDIWQDSFIPPIVEMHTSSRKHWRLALHILEKRGVPQQRNQAMARRLATSIYTNAPLKGLDELNNLPKEDQEAAFQEQGVIITYLGMTRDRRLMDYLMPWLDCRRTIQDLRTNAISMTATPARFYTPPLRVCDAALEAVLRIDGHQKLHEVYSQHPRLQQFEGSTDDLIVTMHSVRDAMIREVKQRRSDRRK